MYRDKGFVLLTCLSSGLFFVIGSSACTRDAVGVCPDIGAGELVVTELRKSQKDGQFPTFVELYNKSNRTLSLAGVALDERRIDDGDGRTFLIREELSIAPGEYKAISTYRPELLSDDAVLKLFDSAVLSVRACDVEVDSIRFEALASSGSWSFGGNPSVGDNSDATQWCVDATADAEPGTPNLANISCAVQEPTEPTEPQR